MKTSFVRLAFMAVCAIATVPLACSTDGYDDSAPRSASR